MTSKYEEIDIISNGIFYWPWLNEASKFLNYAFANDLHFGNSSKIHKKLTYSWIKVIFVWWPFWLFLWIRLKLRPFSLYFEAVLAKKCPLQRRHFPCEFRAHPYLFGIRRARGMGLDRVLIQNQTFRFFDPPPCSPTIPKKVTNVQGSSPRWSRRQGVWL